jgi:glycosyltransferase involved in cell wall biosynthesis
MKVLFVAWDGPQVTYLETLFLPVFERLAAAGLQFHVLQFTWGDSLSMLSTRDACEARGVTYQGVSVLRRPRALGALLSALVGAWRIRHLVRVHGIDVVMPRSTLPALATLLALRRAALPVVFDADGLPLDERVDFAGQSPRSWPHRVLRDVEAQATQRADVVLTRSARAVDILHARAGGVTALDKFHVVTNGRDPGIFRPADASEAARARHDLGIPAGVPLLVYAGSLGTQYCMEEMLRLFALILERRPQAHWLILTGSPELARVALAKSPGFASRVTVRTVSPAAVPRYLACADLGLALRQPSFSMQAVAPIKLGEYLLCGLPVVATAGVGDASTFTDHEGFLLRRMDEAALQAAADWFVNGVLPQREACRMRSRARGLERHSLDASAALYLKAFRSLGLHA